MCSSQRAQLRAAMIWELAIRCETSPHIFHLPAPVRWPASQRCKAKLRGLRKTQWFMSACTLNLIWSWAQCGHMVIKRDIVRQSHNDSFGEHAEALGNKMWYLQRRQSGVHTLFCNDVALSIDPRVTYLRNFGKKGSSNCERAYCSFFVRILYRKSM